MALLSIITTCKGRLEHLKASLPRFMALAGCQVVLVDYDCPDGAGDWARANHPEVLVVRAANQPVFNLARARNLGARAAIAPWVFFADADVLVEPDLMAVVTPHLLPGAFLVPRGGPQELSGSAIVALEDLRAVGGYDEVFEGWGSEDRDLYARLELAGRKARALPPGALTSIPHDSLLRGRFHADPDVWSNGTVNALYAAAKADLIRLGARMDRPARDALYAQARAAAAPGGPGLMEVTVGKGTAAGRPLTTSLRYRLQPARQVT